MSIEFSAVRSALDGYKPSSRGTMVWTEQQRFELAHELARIGYRTGDLWPTPAVEFSPDEILALYRRVPDGAGREGYVAEMAKSVRQVLEG